jgi:hypothetical protein
VSSRPNAIPSLLRLRAALEQESGDGVALLRDLEDNPICSLTRDDDVPCLFISWRGYVSSLQFRFVHENMLVLLQQNSLRKLLGDDTNLPMIHAEDQAWVIEDWLPRATDAGLRAVAHKSPFAHFGKVSVDNVASRIRAKILLRTFERVEEAREWLRAVRV